MAKRPLAPFFKLEFSTKGLVRKVGKGMGEAFKKVTPVMEKEIKAITPVDKGDLQKSVTVRAITRTPNPRIEVKTLFYGLFVEKGTVNMEKQPFIRPVMVGMRKSWEKAIAKEVKKVVNRREKSKGARG